MSTQERARYPWGAADLIGLLAITLLAIFTMRSTWGDILQIAWRDEESSHIYLVPIVAIWMFWIRRGRWRMIRPTHRWIGPLIVAVGWWTGDFGYTHANQALWHGGAVIVLIGAGVTIIGTEVLWRFAPAFAVLIFLIPVPGMLRQDISIPLQERTAEVTHTVFQIFNVPISLSGSVLSFNGMEVGIAEACNGLRMVFALALVSYAFAFGTPLRWYVRLIVIALSPVSAIICNTIRLVPTVWIYGAWGEEQGKIFHDYSGWVMLLISFLLLMGIIRLMRWALVPVTSYTLAYD